MTDQQADKDFILAEVSTPSLKTDMPGVFAIRDVRAASTKRVEAAIGSGRQ